MLGRRQQPASRKTGELRAKAASRPSFNYYSGGTGNKADIASKDSVIHLDGGSLKKRLRLLPTFIAVGIIIGSIFISLTLSTSPSVMLLHGQTSPYRDPAEYAAAAAEIMAQNLSSQTKLTIDTTSVERSLMESFPELRAAVLRLPVLGRKPSIIVDIKPPALLLTTPVNSYVLDNSGMVVSDVSSLEQEARAGLTTVSDKSGFLDMQVGKQALTSDMVRFITGVSEQLAAKGYQISELTLPASVNQLDIRLSGLPYYIKTDTTGDVRLQIGSFLAVKQELEGRRSTPAEYIDVRVEEKVFYR